MSDVIILGGGFAGLSAARRAAELGFRPIVLEKQRDPDYICNSRISGGVLHVADADPRNCTPEQLAAHIPHATFGATAPELVGLLATNGARACAWLASQGVELGRVEGNTQGDWRETVLTPVGTTNGWLGGWTGKGPDNALKLLTAGLVRDRGVIRLGRRVHRLFIESGSVVGVEAMGPEGPETYRGDAVVLADGGFQANYGLVRSHISPRPEEVVQRGAGTGEGVALRVASELGAKLVGLNSFYGHLLSRDALTNPRLWPAPTLDSVGRTGILVDSSGRRFTDESLGGIDMANKLARSEHPSGGWLICDGPAWDAIGNALQDPPMANPAVADNGGTVIVAPSLTELARRAQLPHLVQTITVYNDAVHAGRLSDLDIPRSTPDPARTVGGVRPIHSIESPPFIALPACPGIVFTMGGPLIDNHARVIAETGEPIRGLYAAGSSSGGFDGGEKVGYAGGLLKAVITGIVSVEHIARDRRSDC